jgi:putative transposase
MPRIAREKGEFSTYHIILRGNERKNIFLQDDDKIRFLNIMSRMMEKYNFILESYCLMDNHVHLLINDNGNDISKIIKSINVSYAYYFNHNYKRVGHLFQDRFKR